MLSGKKVSTITSITSCMMFESMGFSVNELSRSGPGGSNFLVENKATASKSLWLPRSRIVSDDRKTSPSKHSKSLVARFSKPSNYDDIFKEAISQRASIGAVLNLGFPDGSDIYSIYIPVDKNYNYPGEDSLAIKNISTGGLALHLTGLVDFGDVAFSGILPKNVKLVKLRANIQL